MNNGRVTNLDQVSNSSPFTMTEYKVDRTFQQDAIKGIQQKSMLNDVYFSDKNIQALQHGIRYLVYKNSCDNFIIDNQSEDELKIVMRSIFLEHAKNQPYNILEQVRELNGKVLEFCVEKILHEVRLYKQYRNDISSLPIPLERSQNISNKGTRTLEIKML